MGEKRAESERSHVALPETDNNRTTPIFPNIVYKCFFTFKGQYAMEICIDMGLGLLIQT